jgi:hypothetical protein
MSIRKPTTALMRRGSTAKPPSPDPLAPISAKTSGPWRKLAEMTGSRFDCFNEQVWPHQDAEGHLHDRASSSLDWMPPARVIAGPRALPHFHSACYEGALSGIGGLGANPRTQPTPGAGRSFPRFHQHVSRIPHQHCYRPGLMTGGQEPHHDPSRIGACLFARPTIAGTKRRPRPTKPPISPERS